MRYILFVLILFLISRLVRSMFKPANGAQSAFNRDPGPTANAGKSRFDKIQDADFTIVDDQTGDEKKD